MMRKLFSVMMIVAMLAVAFASFALAAPGTPGQPEELIYEGANTDNPNHPLGVIQAALKQRGLEAKVNGKVNGPVKEVAKGQFVELERQGEDLIWTVIGEFGPLDSPFGILKSGIPGPSHNQIPEPDRTVDNTTIWTADFTPAYYENMLFSEAPGAVSMRNFYIEESSN